MNKIKIPKNWVFKYFEVEGNTTKFVYEDQLGIEHIYIDKIPEPELPTYEELLDKYNKQKEVLDKIKDKLKEDNKEAVDFTHKIETSDLQQGSYPVHYYRMLWNKELTEKYLELLEEIE